MVVNLIVNTPAKRADIYLSQVLNISRNQIKRQIELGHLRLNNAPFKVSSPLKIGDVITGEIPEEGVDSYLQPYNYPLHILYEDCHILVLNKEKGIVVHPAPGHKNDTLVNAVLNYCKDLKGIGGVLRPGVIHRLDKDTAGVILFAKDEKSYVELQRQFKNREIKKRYLAIVVGVPNPQEGTIHTKIGRDTKDRKRFAVREEGKEAITTYKTLLTKKGISLLEVIPLTGRTHQIRVHMHYMGTPLLGDTLYKKGALKGKINDEWLLRYAQTIKGQLLFAESLEFTHPISGERMCFKGIMPEDMKTVIEWLKDNGTNS